MTLIIGATDSQWANLWTPHAIEPLATGSGRIWLDATQTFRLTLVGDKVSEWGNSWQRNNSDFQHRVSQGTDARRPTLVDNVLNGRPVVRFDGTSTWLRSQWQTVFPSSAYEEQLKIISGYYLLSMAAVVSGATGGVVLSNKDGGPQNNSYALNVNGLFIRGGTSRTARDATTPTGFNLLSAVSNTSSVRAFRNGTLISTQSANSNSTTENTQPFAIGASNVTVTPPSEMFNGDIAEIILTRWDWTDDIRWRIEGYLAHKWGLTAGLPSDHPYKSVAPRY